MRDSVKAEWVEAGIRETLCQGTFQEAIFAVGRHPRLTLAEKRQDAHDDLESTMPPEHRRHSEASRTSSTASDAAIQDGAEPRQFSAAKLSVHVGMQLLGGGRARRAVAVAVVLSDIRTLLAVWLFSAWPGEHSGSDFRQVIPGAPLEDRACSADRIGNGIGDGLIHIIVWDSNF